MPIPKLFIPRVWAQMFRVCIIFFRINNLVIALYTYYMMKEYSKHQIKGSLNGSKISDHDSSDFYQDEAHHNHKAEQYSLNGPHTNGKYYEKDQQNNSNIKSFMPQNQSSMSQSLKHSNSIYIGHQKNQHQMILATPQHKKREPVSQKHQPHKQLEAQHLQQNEDEVVIALDTKQVHLELEATIARLQNQLRQAESKAEKLSSNLKSRQEYIAELQDDLTLKKQQINDLRKLLRQGCIPLPQKPVKGPKQDEKQLKQLFELYSHFLEDLKDKSESSSFDRFHNSTYKNYTYIRDAQIEHYQRQLQERDMNLMKLQKQLEVREAQIKEQFKQLEKYKFLMAHWQQKYKHSQCSNTQFYQKIIKQKKLFDMFRFNQQSNPADPSQPQKDQSNSSIRLSYEEAGRKQKLRQMQQNVYGRVPKQED